MPKILITGGSGMLGRTLRRAWADKYEVVSTDLPEVDITDAAAFNAVLKREKPDTVVHCAAMTQVDACETAREGAFRVNAYGTQVVASACHLQQVRLIAISTDYVFDGYSDRPYCEYDQPTGGRTVYGQSKLAGEQAVRTLCPRHVIARISWLYGPGGPSFVHAMVKLATSGKSELKVVDDQHGNPTSTLAVAARLETLIEHPELVGTFHLTCEGVTTWAGFAQEIFSQLKLDCRVIPCTTAEFPRPAARPANSALDKLALRCAKLPPMPDWREALRAFLPEEFPQLWAQAQK